VRDALRDWRLRRKIETLEAEELRRLMQKGIASGPSLDANAVFARLRPVRSATRRLNMPHRLLLSPRAANTDSLHR
jgi:antitoxin ParD1/3/4